MPWWQVFQDPVLQGLIRTALTNNYDLQQAVARMEEARYQASAASSAFFPQINYGADAGRGRNAYYNSPANLNGVTKKFRHRQFERILGDSFLGPHPPFH